MVDIELGSLEENTIQEASEVGTLSSPGIEIRLERLARPPLTQRRETESF